MKRRELSLGLLLVIVLLFAGRVSLGQSDRGTITGTVTDPSGAVIPDATVTVINANTNAKSVVLSTSSGSYAVPQLPTGTYKISVEKQGFKTAVRENLPLLLGQTVREDIGLEVGESSQTVEVEASAPLLKPETSEFSTAISHKEIINLPLAMSGEA